MTNQDGLQLFREADEVLINSLVENRSEVPKNSPAHENDVDILHRARDRAVFNFIHEAKPGEFDAVRGAFAQGDQVSVNSGFRLRTHVQIALKNNKCVLGWFLPPDTKLLSENEYSLAKDRLSAAKAAVTARKRRVRA
ncbi:hypothetical protein [Delftia sp. GW456-R20]|uniref:hypothetical protein n=1 Tax=Delftia sp. GW456-R20 TaxID=1827145 RepID=UPI000A7CAEEB|nr:hypothetical protein [Delftia sp. GW456-R20]